MPMDFITFHVDPPCHAKRSHPNVNLGPHAYKRMIDMLFRSVRIFHAQSRCTLLSNPETRVDGIRAPFDKFNLQVNHSALMLSRSEAQLAYLQAQDFSQPLVFIDSDILINAALTPLFEEDFDVALTWRQSSTMPINGGLIILNNRRPEIAKKFFRDFVEIYRKNYADQGAWYGDQLAMRDLVGLNHRQMQQASLIHIQDCRVLLLSCDIYNFSPENNFNSIVNRPIEKAVLHFKGERKRLMSAFWDAHLLPIESSGLGAIVRSYLARRRIAKMALIESEKRVLEDNEDD